MPVLRVPSFRGEDWRLTEIWVEPALAVTVTMQAIQRPILARTRYGRWPVILYLPWISAANARCGTECVSSLRTVYPVPCASS